jgi:hypothetical protein
VESEFVFEKIYINVTNGKKLWAKVDLAPESPLGD